MAANLELALRIKALVEGKPSVDALTGGMRDLNKVASVPIPDNTERLRAGLEKTERRSDQLSDALRALAAAATLREFAQANSNAESLDRSFEILTGDSKKAADELEFVRKTAETLGLEIQSTGKAYLGLVAAAKGTVLEGEATRQIFTSIAGAMANLGKSSAETEGALLAVQQIISKGTVSAEELRGQLGERLPGAFQIAAQAVGKTTAELGKMLEQGQLAATDFLPKFAQAVGDSFGVSGEKVDTFAAQMARAQNAVNAAFVAIGNTGAFKGLSEAAALAASSVTGAVETVNVLGKTIGIVTAAIANLDFSHVGEDIDKVLQDSADRLAKVNENSGLVSSALGGVGQAAEKAAPQVAALTKELGDLSKIEQQTADESLKAADQRVTAAKLESDALANRNNVALATLEADRAQADAARQLAQARGDSIEAHRREAEVARISLQIASQAEQAARDEVASIRAQIDAIERQGEAEGTLSDKQIDHIEKLRALLPLKEQNVRVTEAETVATKAQIQASGVLNQGIGGIKAAYDGSLGSVQAVSNAISDANEKREKEFKQIGDNKDATDKQSQAQAGVTEEVDKTAKATESAQEPIKLISGILEEVAQKAEAAGRSQRDSAASSSAALDRLNRGYEALKQNLELIQRFGRGADAAANPELFARIRLIEDYRDRLTEVVNLTDQLTKATANGTLTAGQLAQATNAAASASQVLADEDLAQFRSAIEDARRKMQAVEDQTRSATDRIAELDAQIAAAQGDKERADALRRDLKLQQDLREIEAQRAKAQAEGNRELLQLLDEQARKVKTLADLDEANAKRQARQAQNRNEPDAGESNVRTFSRPSGGQGGGLDTRALAKAFADEIRGNLNLQLDGDILTRNVMSRAAVINGRRR